MVKSRRVTTRENYDKYYIGYSLVDLNESTISVPRGAKLLGIIPHAEVIVEVGGELVRQVRDVVAYAVHENDYENYKKFLDAFSPVKRKGENG